MVLIATDFLSLCKLPERAAYSTYFPSQEQTNSGESSFDRITADFVLVREKTLNHRYIWDKLARIDTDGSCHERTKEHADRK